MDPQNKLPGLLMPRTRTSNHSTWQRLVALGVIMGGIGGFLASIGTAAQGWAAYNDWACKVGWPPRICPMKQVRSSQCLTIGHRSVTT